MKKIAFPLAIILALLLIGYIYLLKSPNQQNIPLPAPTPTAAAGDNSLGFCNPEDLDAQMDLEGAAGNIYGNLTIKNVSDKTCKIIGNNFIVPSFSAKNITVKTQGATGTDIFTLSPAQTVYSQIHYPNGPQCNGPTLQTNVSFSYKISEKNLIIFNNQKGESKQSIGVCQLASQLTEIDTWSLSENPTNQ